MCHHDLFSRVDSHCGVVKVTNRITGLKKEHQRHVWSVLTEDEKILLSKVVHFGSSIRKITQRLKLVVQDFHRLYVLVVETQQKKVVWT